MLASRAVFAHLGAKAPSREPGGQSNDITLDSGLIRPGNPFPRPRADGRRNARHPVDGYPGQACFKGNQRHPGGAMAVWFPGTADSAGAGMAQGYASGLLPNRIGLNIARALLMACAVTSFFTALRWMPVPDAIAVFFVEPADPDHPVRRVPERTHRLAAKNCSRRWFHRRVDRCPAQLRGLWRGLPAAGADRLPVRNLSDPDQETGLERGPAHHAVLLRCRGFRHSWHWLQARAQRRASPYWPSSGPARCSG